MTDFEEFKVGYDKVLIHKDWKVIEIGGGANPCPRANVILNYKQSENQRNKKIKNVPGAEMIETSMENMSMFDNNQFDFSLCIQTIEHVDNPEKACLELMRISKSGYVEMPSKLCELTIGWPFHKWMVYIDPEDKNRLIFEKKKKIHYKRMDDFFWNLFYKDRNQRFIDIVKKYSDLWITKFHWRDSFKFKVIL